MIFSSRSFLKVFLLCYGLNVARCLTVFLRGPVLTLRRGANAEFTDGMGGLDGWEGHGVSKVSFSFSF